LKELWTLNKYFIRYKWRFLAGIAFVILMNYFRIVQPQMIGSALDLVVAELKNPSPESAAVLSPKLLRFALIVFGCAILMGLFMYFMRQSIIVMSRLIEFDLREAIYNHYSELDQTFYRGQTTGDLMSRIVLVVASMVKVDLTLSLLTLLPLPFLSISIYYVSTIINKRSTKIQKQLSKLTTIAQEVYSGIRIVKSYAQEKAMSSMFSREAETYKEATWDLSKVNALFFPLIMLLTGISTVVIVWAGAYRVQAGVVTAGNIAEFVIYINMLSWPVTAIGWLASIVQQAEASMKRINEFMHTSSNLGHTGNLEPANLSGKIEFKNVSFVYSNTGIKALDNLSFTIEPGARVAIIGRTASGKTTIAELLLRLFDAEEGQILIDGIDIRQYNIHALRSKIGYVPQDQFLFSESIEDNIKFGAPEADTDQVLKSARHAAILDEIERLPGGQKQRVAIARALIKNPDILLLDDCLSAVDTRTEKAILGEFDEALASKTSILITHRISHLANFSLIMVLHKGRLAEVGTHEDLLQSKGLYFDIMEQQKWEESKASAELGTLT